MTASTPLFLVLGVIAISGCSSSECGPGQTVCGDVCVNTRTDRLHCGACGQACRAGDLCDGSGVCQLSCQPGLVSCGGKCIDPTTDTGFCGATDDCQEERAGVACAPGQRCNGAGACAGSCQSGRLACGDRCANPASDSTFCGASGDCSGANAGTNCGVNATCKNGACITYGPSTFLGPRKDVPMQALAGVWSVCHTSLYNEALTTTQVTGACLGAELMFACRPKGSSVLTLAAHAPRTTVFLDVGTASGTINVANGSNWYFNGATSMGFALAGEPLTRSPCDGGSGPNPESRLCWHTEGSAGYRCGATTGLNADPNWERVILQR